MCVRVCVCVFVDRMMHPCLICRPWTVHRLGPVHSDVSAMNVVYVTVLEQYSVPTTSGDITRMKKEHKGICT